MEKTISLIIAALCLSLASACSKSEAPSRSEEIRQPLEGSLEANVLEIQKSTWVEDCDIDWGPQALEVARALDLKKSEIENYQKLSKMNKTPAVPFGKSFIKHREKDLYPVSGWIEESISWAELYGWYSKIKNTSVDSTWVGLLSETITVIGEDADRVQGYSNPYLTEESELLLGDLVHVMETCVDSLECFSSSLSPSLQKFMLTQLDYLEIYLRAKKQVDPLLKKEKFKNLVSRARSDLSSYFKFRVNKNILRQSPFEFILPLDVGEFDFPETKNLIQNEIETMWRNSTTNLQVKVKWSDSKAYSDLFKFVIGPTWNGRSNVSHQNNQIILQPGLNKYTIAHEAGHVLGFRDNYFTHWEPKSCLYKVRANTLDVMSMSDSLTATVTADEWKKLDEIYPYKR